MMNKKTPAIEYDVVLPTHTYLNIWEVYARLVLQFIDAATYESLSHGDKPDLRDDTLGLGVEITQALSPRCQEADALYAKLQTQNNECSRTRIIERIEQLGGKVLDYGLFGPNGQDSLALVIDAFRDKLAKLNGGGYETFEHNHLFIRSDVFANNVMLDQGLADFVALNTQPASFERVIVSVPGHNYDFDLIKCMYRDLSFSFTDQYKIAKRARALVIEAENTYAAK